MMPPAAAAATLDAALERALSGLQTDVPESLLVDDHGAQALITVPGDPLASFLQVMSWALLAAGVVLLVAVLGRSLVARLESRAGEGADSDPAPDEGPASGPAAPPEAALGAASRGDFGEALRLLLGEVLPLFYTGRGDGWPAAWTSRQCLGRVSPQEPARADLAQLVAVVERHHFGGRPAGPADWECWAGRLASLRPTPPTAARS
ncbi:MAG: DUF4129 domain-containing protein [Candidatus Krumholzibacteriia bacterium]